MKKKYRFILYLRCVLFACLCIGNALLPAQTIDSYIGSYSGENKNGYLQPVASVISSAFNTGQVTHTGLDSNFRVYFHLIGTASFILGDGLKYFEGTTPEGFLPSKSASVPTLLGPRESVTVQGINGTAYTFPAGMGIKILSLVVPQLSLAYGKTELNFRFATGDTDDEIGRINYWGLGLRHDLGQYLMPGSPWLLSVGGMYQKVKVGSYANLSAYNGSLTAGQEWKHVYYFFQAGYQAGKLKSQYHHFNGENKEVVRADLSSDNPLFIGAGLGLKLGFLQLQWQVQGYEPLIGSFALGFRF